MTENVAASPNKIDVGNSVFSKLTQISQRNVFDNKVEGDARRKLRLAWDKAAGAISQERKQTERHIDFHQSVLSGLQPMREGKKEVTIRPELQHYIGLLEFDSQRELSRVVLHFRVTENLQTDKMREYVIKKIIDERKTKGTVSISMATMHPQYSLETDTCLYEMSADECEVIMDFVGAKEPREMKRRTFFGEIKEKVIKFDRIHNYIKLLPSSKYDFERARAFGLFQQTAASLAKCEIPNFDGLPEGVVYAAFCHAFHPPDLNSGWFKSLKERVLELSKGSIRVSDLGNCGYVDCFSHVVLVEPIKEATTSTIEGKALLNKKPMWLVFGPFRVPFKPIGAGMKEFYVEITGAKMEATWSDMATRMNKPKYRSRVADILDRMKAADAEAAAEGDAIKARAAMERAARPESPGFSVLSAGPEMSFDDGTMSPYQSPPPSRPATRAAELAAIPAKVDCGQVRRTHSPGHSPPKADMVRRAKTSLGDRGVDIVVDGSVFRTTSMFFKDDHDDGEDSDSGSGSGR